MCAFRKFRNLDFQSLCSNIEIVVQITNDRTFRIESRIYENVLYLVFDRP